MPSCTVLAVRENGHSLRAQERTKYIAMPAIKRTAA
jgi:hypothetical protein